jgi:hypothetical protein
MKKLQQERRREQGILLGFKEIPASEATVRDNEI